MSHLLVPGHPLICEALAICRDASTPTAQFRAAMTQIGRFLAYELLREWLPTTQSSVQTPLGVSAPTRRIDTTQNIEIVPILRAGLALVEGVLPLLPSAKIHHLGYRRDETSGEASCYLSGLPQELGNQTRFLILEPMIATGGTLVQVLDELCSRGACPENIAVISLIASQNALHRLAESYGDILVCCAAIDPKIDERFFIVPGLGDAGDRAFGTA